MIAFALVVAGATLTVGIVAALALRLLPTVRGQLAGLALLAVGLPLSAVVLSGIVMFTDGHDLVILGVAAASSSAAVAAALLLARDISSRLAHLQAASTRLAAGDLGARAPEGGPSELAELARALNQTAGSLEELFDARRQLVAWASHDLRTPLASIRAMIEALEDGLVEPERYLPIMREQADKLAALVDDLFELARIDAGALTLEVRELPLTGLVDSCLRGLEAEAEARHVRLEARIDRDVPRVRCAPEQIERVLYNLLTNALRHTPSDGSVAVLVQPLPDRVRVSVEDTGEGLAPGSARRMFDRFWRDDEARSSDRGGAGLGLAIARGLVEAHGGSIWAENRPEGGARVSFTLPTG